MIDEEKKEQLPIWTELSLLDHKEALMVKVYNHQNAPSNQKEKLGNEFVSLTNIKLFRGILVSNTVNKELKRALSFKHATRIRFSTFAFQH